MLWFVVHVIITLILTCLHFNYKSTFYLYVSTLTSSLKLKNFTLTRNLNIMLNGVLIIESEWYVRKTLIGWDHQWGGKQFKQINKISKIDKIHVLLRTIQEILIFLKKNVKSHSVYLTQQLSTPGTPGALHCTEPRWNQKMKVQIQRK